MTQLDLFAEMNPVAQAIQAGTGQANACTRKADALHAGWSDRAFDALCRYAQAHCVEPWTAEDCTGWAHTCGGVALPHDERAWGVVFLRAQKESVITRSQVFYKRRKGHGAEARMWETARN